MGLLIRVFNFANRRKKEEERKMKTTSRLDYKERIKSRLGPWGLWGYNGPVAKYAYSIPPRPLRWRALTANELGNSCVMGGGGWNPWSYEKGLWNAIARCCAIFGVDPLDIGFRKLDGNWYQVEIEDLFLLTEDDGCESFGRVYWLLAPCPHCGKTMKGSRYFSDLSGLGEAIKMHEPQEEHFEDCYPWRKACAEKLGDFLLVCAVEYVDWKETCAVGQ